MTGSKTFSSYTMKMRGATFSFAPESVPPFLRSGSLAAPGGSDPFQSVPAGPPAASGAFRDPSTPISFMVPSEGPPKAQAGTVAHPSGPSLPWPIGPCRNLLTLRGEVQTILPTKAMQGSNDRGMHEPTD